MNPLNSDPALVGRELRNHLDAAGIKERNCVFCVPLGWALSIQTKVPNIPDADLQSFLAIEAERGFPYAPGTLAIGSSVCPGTSYIAQERPSSAPLTTAQPCSQPG